MVLPKKKKVDGPNCVTGLLQFTAANVVRKILLD